MRLRIACVDVDDGEIVDDVVEESGVNVENLVVNDDAKEGAEKEKS